MRKQRRSQINHPMGATAMIGRLARRRARLRSFKDAKPLSEEEIRRAVSERVQDGRVTVCPPAYLVKTQALDRKKR